MKRNISKAELTTFITELDTRMKTWDEPKIDRAINNGFAELNTISQPFMSESNTSLIDYYELLEYRFTIEPEDDIVSIYDMYLMRQDQDELFNLHGEEKDRDPNRIFKDPNNNNIINVDLNTEDGSVYDFAVVKYFYVPTADFDNLFVSQEVYIAIEASIAAAAYDMVHDIEAASQKRSAMKRLGMSILDVYPSDYSEPGKNSMFPDGV